jgi:hypothetical protein
MQALSNVLRISAMLVMGSRFTRSIRDRIEQMRKL